VHAGRGARIQSCNPPYRLELTAALQAYGTNLACVLLTPASNFPLLTNT
jgi:hypothetical protein